MRLSGFILGLFVTSSLVPAHVLAGGGCSKGTPEEEEEKRPLVRAAPQAAPAIPAAPSAADVLYQQGQAPAHPVLQPPVATDNDIPDSFDPSATRGSQGAKAKDKKSTVEDPTASAVSRKDDDFEEVSITADPLEDDKASLEEQRARIAKLEADAKVAEERLKIEQEKARLREDEAAARLRLEEAQRAEERLRAEAAEAAEKKQLVVFSEIRKPGASLALQHVRTEMKRLPNGDFSLALLPERGGIFSFMDVEQAKKDKTHAAFIKKYHEKVGKTFSKWEDLTPSLQKVFRIIAEREKDAIAQESIEEFINCILRLAIDENPGDIPVALAASETDGWANILVMFDKRKGAVFFIPKREHTK